MFEDTITAISTPLGEGGVGIIRISGKDAFLVASRIFRPAREKDWLKETYKLHYGHVMEDKTGRVIDEVLISMMKAPHTYTREDVVEINCHGGIIPLRKVLKAVLSAGARLAEPGEFTKRAFLNGRIDLTQAESVIDIIRAKTDTSLRVALSQLNGRLSKKIHSIQDKLLGLLAGIEAAIDFPEDDIEEKNRTQMAETAEKIIREMDSLIETAGTGRIYREGIRTVIVGRPNVGKSSLLNALLGQERAIVTHIPGTTRDVIEETLNIKGIPLILTDTAGLRETQDLVEKIGVEKTREFMAGSDLILFVVDAVEGINQEDKELLEEIDKTKIILIFNKIDIERNNSLPKEVNVPWLGISAVTGEGLETLEDTIERVIVGGRTTSPESLIISRARHEEAIRRARTYMDEFYSSIDSGVPIDLLSIDVRNAWESLGEITGSTVTEDLLDRIFKDFCIGK